MADVRTFGRYRVTGALGAGAMGEVLAATDELLGREVAVKTLRGRTSGLAARLADERFRLEARAIAALTHPSVVQVYDLDLTADPPYLVMERVAGPSLKERLTGGALPEHEVRALGIQMANALAAAHARGVVHRDVKPANILAAGPGVWKLADFGVAHVPDSSLTMTGQFVGSPAYAPPEALVRGQLGPESDVFSLGATLYEAAAGSWPRATASTGGLLAPVAPLRELAPGVSPALAAAIDRAVAVEPADRPSAAELASALAMGDSLVGAAPAVGGAAMPGAAIAGAPRAVGAVALPPAGTATAWVATSPGAATGAGATAAGGSALAKAAARYRWKHAIAGIATLLAIVLIAVTRSSPDAPAGARVTSGEPPAAAAPGELSYSIRANAPPIRDEEAAKDWRKVVDKLRKQHFGEARRKLAEWEDKHGATAETADLAKQLDALPEELKRPRGKPRKHRERD